YNTRGATRVLLGQYADSIEDFTKAIQIDSKQLNSYVNRAGAYREIGEFEKSLTDYKRAKSISPKFAGIYSNSAITYLRMGQYKNAVEE
ncbi:tetratricopeptide repeat protein, partial [Acinetobacter baumannii]